MRSHRAICVVFAMSVGCVADVGLAAPTEAPVDDPSSCLVDGAPLDSIEPPTERICFERDVPERVANLLRLYQQARYAEAVTLIEAWIMAGPDPEHLMWWRHARFFLAKTYWQLGRRTEAEALLLDIVRATDDPYRWAAAGWLCGQLRPAPEHVDWPTPAGACPAR